jgi:hypothetical protein
VLLVAALLLLLGGANRGRVPANEREGSRTGDEPAARSIRFLAAADEGDDHRSASRAGDGIASARELVELRVALTLGAAPIVAPRVHAARLDCRSCSPRGPPTRA